MQLIASAYFKEKIDMAAYVPKTRSYFFVLHTPDGKKYYCDR